MGQLIRNGNKVKFDEKGCKIYNKDNVLVGIANLENNVYKLNLERQNVSLLSTTSLISSNLQDYCDFEC